MEDQVGNLQDQVQCSGTLLAERAACRRCCAKDADTGPATALQCTRQQIHESTCTNYMDSLAIHTVQLIAFANTED